MSERRRLPFLPEDLITENILIRLPVKSVGRFRCVSKPWRSLLSTPKFARAHFKIHSDHDPEGSILVSFSPNFAFCTLNLGNENRMVSRTTRSLALPPYEGSMNELQGSCHGLVLVKQKGSLDLFNPITRETLKIPEFCEWSYDLGLGYDSNQDDYKIVCLRADETRTLGIFSLKLKTWRNVGIGNGFLHVEDGGLFVNGSLHWPAWAQHGFVLAAFCLDMEEFRELPPPKGIEQVILCCFRLTILGGRLALIYKEDGVMDIWVMKEYGVQDSWTKYTLDMSMSGCLKDVGVMGEDEIVFVKRG